MAGSIFNITAMMRTDTTQFTKGMKDAGKQTKEFGGNMSVVKEGLLSAFTGAGMVAIIGVGNELRKVDTIATGLDATFSVIKGTLSTIVTEYTKFNSADMLKRIKESAQAGWDFAYAMDAINDAFTRNSNQIVQWEAEKERLLLLSKNVNDTEENRIGYLQEAFEIEKQILKVKTDDAKLRYDEAIKKNAATFGVDPKLLNRFIQANAETANLMLESNTDLNRAINHMGGEREKELSDLYNAVYLLNAESDKSMGRLNSRLSGLIKETTDGIKEATEATRQWGIATAELNTRYKEMIGAEIMGKSTEKTGTVSWGYMENEPELFDNSEFEKMGEQLLKMQDKIKAFTEEANAMLTNFKADMIATFAEAFGEAIGSGDWENFGSSIIDGLSSFLKQFGALLIAYGTADMALKFGDPASKIAAGVALVAIGGAISGLQQRQNQSMSSGGYQQQPVIVQVDGQISGKNLKIVQRRTP